MPRKLSITYLITLEFKRESTWIEFEIKSRTFTENVLNLQSLLSRLFLRNMFSYNKLFFYGVNVAYTVLHSTSSSEKRFLISRISWPEWCCEINKNKLMIEVVQSVAPSTRRTPLMSGGWYVIQIHIQFWHVVLLCLLLTSNTWSAMI